MGELVRFVKQLILVGAVLFVLVTIWLQMTIPCPWNNLCH